MVSRRPSPRRRERRTPPGKGHEASSRAFKRTLATASRERRVTGARSGAPYGPLATRALREAIGVHAPPRRLVDGPEDVDLPPAPSAPPRIGWPRRRPRSAQETAAGMAGAEEAKSPPPETNAAVEDRFLLRLPKAFRKSDAKNGHQRQRRKIQGRGAAADAFLDSDHPAATNVNGADGKGTATELSKIQSRATSERGSARRMPDVDADASVKKAPAAAEKDLRHPFGVVDADISAAEGKDSTEKNEEASDRFLEELDGELASVNSMREYAAARGFPPPPPPWERQNTPPPPTSPPPSPGPNVIQAPVPVVTISNMAQAEQVFSSWRRGEAVRMQVC